MHIKIHLTEIQKLALEVRHSTERDGRTRDRIKAVLLHIEGWTQKQIAQALRINEETVHNHLLDYENEGKLKPDNGGSKGKLNQKQADNLLYHLESNTYPTTKLIIKYVQDVYSISYTQQGMYDWLIAHGFTFKKPKGIPAKANKEKQAAFIEKYMELKDNLKPGEIIVSMDSVHPTQATKITYGWIKKGVEKLIATTASRTRMNITGAIDLESMNVITEEYETINAASIVDFLKKVEKHYSNATKIHVIADGAGTHTAHEVQLFLGNPNAVNRDLLKTQYSVELPSDNKPLSKKIKKKLEIVMAQEPQLFENKEILQTDDLTSIMLLNSLKQSPPHQKLVMHTLPAYSPNLSPIERLWKVMNETVRNNVFFETCSQFKNSIREFFSTTWNDIKEGMRGRINDNFQILKSAT